MIQKTSTLRKLSLALLLFAGVRVVAQVSDPPRIGLRIQAFTSEERDALVRQLHTTGEMRLAYACVPAGIVLLESTTTARSHGEARTAMMARVAAVVPEHRILENGLDLQSAEERCAIARRR